MFKKITFLFVLLSSLSAHAQFTIDEDTLYISGPAGIDSNEFIDIYAHTVIRNTGGNLQSIIWTRLVNDLPSPKWTSAICDIISCRAPEVGNDSFTFISSGDTGILSFHFYSKNIPGTGYMTVRFARANNPLEFEDVVINATAWHPVGIKNYNILQISVYPNPAKNSIEFVNAAIGSGNIQIYNTLGQLVKTSDFNERIVLDIQDLDAGIYTVRIVGENGVSSTTFIKE